MWAMLELTTTNQARDISSLPSKNIILWDFLT